MKLKRMFVCMVMMGAVVFETILGCALAEAVCFTDALGREVSVSAPRRVGIASGSLAECWTLAGGEVCAVTRDAEERKLELPEGVIDLGSLKEPSLEAILAADLDFLILIPSLKSHLSMAETLDKTGIPYAYFSVEDFEDYLKLLKLFTDITGRKDLYEINGASIQPRIAAALERGRLAESAKILILRTSSGKVKALDSSFMVGGMLSEFGCLNIADSNSGLLTELSLEAIVQENPEYIFISCMGDVEEGMALLELLALGDETAFSLGIPVKRARLLFLLCAACMAGAAVSFAGLIGFLGLIVPHAARLVTGEEIRKLFPLSLVWGALAMLVCDTIARTAFAPFELSVGIVLSIVGAPVFIRMLLKKSR